MIKVGTSIVIIALVLWGGYALWEKWQSYDTKQVEQQKQEEKVTSLNPDTLPGMPPAFIESYKKAEEASKKGDITALRNWLKIYGQRVDDPRRAWIELDYMVLISKSDPQEAKKIFADIKGRIPEDSPIMPRVKLLEKTYQ